MTEVIDRIPCRIKRSGLDRGGNLDRALTHSLDSTEEGLAVNATRTCTIDGCNLRYLARGLCRLHYERAKKTGFAGYPTTRAPQTRCSVEGCAKKSNGAMCSMHRARVARTGSLAPRTKPTTAERRSLDLARFWAKVDKRGPDECWPWLGTVLANGYGQFGANGTRHLPHRFMHELEIGPIPDGYEVDHVRARGCVRRDCVNPAHLEAVTPRENKLRSDNVAGTNARKQTCRLGHDYRTARDGSRFCPTCKLEWERNRKRELSR